MLASLNAISRQQDKSGPITTFYHIPGIKTQWKKNTEKKNWKSSRKEKTDKLSKLFRFNSRVGLDKRALPEC